VKRAEKLKIIVETIMEALPALGSLGTLLMLFIFLFTIVGIQIFSFVQL
jgi:ABC-type anion transport system duplicated permease subunit